MLEDSVPEGLHPLEETYDGVVCEELQPMGRLMLEKFVENCLQWDTSHAGAGEE